MKLRMMTFALILAAPGFAGAEELSSERLPASPMGLEVRAEGGVTLGRVEGVQRNSQGRIVAVDAPGLEPEDAPASAEGLYADAAEGFRIRANPRAAPERRAEISDALRSR